MIDLESGQCEWVNLELGQGEGVDLGKLREPYVAALNGDWDALKSFFTKKENRQLLFASMTIDSDTALHIAAYSGNKNVLQHLVGLLPPERVHEALSRKNDHGNNTFHEVATTDNVEAAKLLVDELNDAEVHQILKAENQLGETPVYRAAAHGHTKMAKFLLENCDRIDLHIQRSSDSVSILHVAVIGQHFDTAIWLLGKDKTLATREATIREGESGQTCLQLLAKMPTAFRSTSPLGTLERFVYVCLPGYVDDVDDGAQTLSSQMEDSVSGQSIQSKNLSSRDSQIHSSCSQLHLRFSFRDFTVELSEFDVRYRPSEAIKAQALVDFIVEFTPAHDQQNENKRAREWIIHVDGSSIQHVGGVEVILQSPKGDLLEYAFRLQFQTTNNEAEYKALIIGLDLAKVLEAEPVVVQGDSQFIIGLVNGTCKAKEE
ncbi:uncharacterized protein LOC115991060 [Quercus lobata]|uniref:uncharacterized protein LOC115991060 n=1 Tax=Quercus lobata TaxID=97700 RepID=UPI001246CE45|nr:uncharacterized protein LOC115991060 [Quercus lobata]